MSEDELVNLLTIARVNNNRQKLTGVLIYSGGTFIQVLEGEESSIDQIFGVIEQDSRHKNVLKLLDEIVTERTFPDWSMGFTSLEPDKTKNLIGFLNSTKELLTNNERDNAVTMIKTFISANNVSVSF